MHIIFRIPTNKAAHDNSCFPINYMNYAHNRIRKKNLLKTNVDLHTRRKDPTKTEPLSFYQTHRSRALYTPPSQKPGANSSLRMLLDQGLQAARMVDTVTKIA